MYPLRKILLFPFGVIYLVITSIRNKLFDWKLKKSTSFDLPIICIGNIAIGGTGKTPHTEYLIRLLKNNYQLATLSRGYGRKTKDYTIANSKSTAKEVGDEPSQYKRKFPNLTVAVENNRVKGVENILSDFPKTEVILLDDAFQHRAIKAGFNLVVTDYNFPLSKDFLLPAGNLRESKKAIKRADAIVVSKCPKNLTDSEQQKIIKSLKFHTTESIYFTSVSYGDIYSIFNNHLFNSSTLEFDILLVTGIAKPKPLIEYVSTLFRTVRQLTFKDHHNFTAKDVTKIVQDFEQINAKNKIILTTEKDASRLMNIEPLKELPIFCIEIKVDFLNKKDKFNEQIETYVRTNKANC